MALSQKHGHIARYKQYHTHTRIVTNKATRNSDGSANSGKQILTDN